MLLGYHQSHFIEFSKEYDNLHNYNCSIFKHEYDTYLLTRHQTQYGASSSISLTKLASDLKSGYTQPIELPIHCTEDPRAVSHNGDIYVFFNTGGTGTLEKRTEIDYTIFVACIDKNCNVKYMKPCLFDGRGRCEKNWMFFVNKGKWHCIYSINPWRVLEFNDNWEGKEVENTDYSIPWSWGQLRGGSLPVVTPPQTGVFAFGKSEPVYTMFFHSAYYHPLSYKFPNPIYVGGLITFETEFPFKPLKISRCPVLEPDIFNPSPIKAWVIFPSGAIYDKGRWIVSSGWNDHQCRIDMLDHVELTHEINAYRIP